VGRFQDPSLFEKHIKPVDLEVMNEIDESFEFNILHICDYHEEYGSYGDLTPFLEYPGRVVNVSTQIGGKQLTPSKISEIFNRPYMGGMNRLGPIAGGTKGDIRSASKSVLEDAPAGFILGADCTIPGDSPWENLKIAIHEAHAMNRSE
jgi:uroporphyrinogen decarboxylase